MRSPYSILGIEVSAKGDDIKGAYRKLAMIWHPDQNPDDPKAAEVFAEISNAYQLLSDPPRRKLFDSGKIDANGRRRKTKTVVKTGAHPFSNKPAKQDRATTGSNASSANMQQDMQAAGKPATSSKTASSNNYGGQPKPQAHAKTDPAHKTHKTQANQSSQNGDAGFSDMISHIFGSPEERASFEQKAEKIARERDENFHQEALNELDDAFVKFQKNREAQAGPSALRAPDRYYLVEVDLADIFTGVTLPIQPENKNSLNVHIPAGTLEGEKIIIEGLAECRKGELPGDVIVTVKYRPNEKFWIRNGELHTYLAVDLTDAVLGGDVTATTPEGPVSFSLPQWTSSNHIIRIPKRGLPQSNGERGDLCANVCILLPEQPNAALKEAMLSTRKSWFV